MQLICILVYNNTLNVIFLSTIRIDEKHQKLLDKLISHLILRGNKISKKELVAKLIEDAMMAEGLEENEGSNPISEDHAWKGLDDVYELGIEDLSEKVDDLLYKLNEEE